MDNLVILLFENQILDNARSHRGHILIRKQHCVRCHKVLAIEITDKLGARGEYHVVKDSLQSPFGIDFLFGKEVWFGNFVRCLNCGLEGRLPMDKPLSAENIAKPKEVKNGKAAKISST